jgi:hypothetical protein
MDSVPVLMQLDAGIRIPIGPVRFSLRSIALIIAVSPLMVPVLSVGLPPTLQVAAIVGLFGLAFIGSVPTSEGIWLGTLAAYRLGDRWLPRLVDRGQVRRARFRRLAGVGVVVDRQRRPVTAPSPFHHWTSLPRLAGTDESLFERRPGGWCVLFELVGSEHPPMTHGHAQWAQSAVAWARAVGCAAQFVCTSDHMDGPAATRAFDVRHRPQESFLDEVERWWAMTMGEASLRIQNHVVLFPQLAGRNGMPTVCSPFRLAETGEASWAEAVRLRDLALRQAGNLRLRVRALPADEVRRLLETTLLGARSASLQNGLLEVAAESHAFLAALRLPPATFSGAAVSALARA